MRYLSCLALVAVLIGGTPDSHSAASPLPAGDAVPQSSRPILVTGASTGIGRAITERLAADGHIVYAGARKPEDLAALARIPNVRPLKLDVTNPGDIAAAVETITKAGRGLYALVNNAGVAITGPFADTRDEDFDWVMQVNTYGPFHVTKAFMPLLVASKGRVTTIGSLSGTLSGRDLGVYSMSKHAIEAFTDSLALQLEPLGVAVSVIVPGNYDTRIGATADQRQSKSTSFADRSRYRPPVEVAATVAQALLEPRPRRRYLIVPEQREAEVTIRKAIEELVQLNEGHAHSYDRDTLVRMLDAALAGARPRAVAR